MVFAKANWNNISIVINALHVLIYFITTISDFDVCPVCEVDVQSSLNRDFFLVLPLEHQLREMLENSNLFDLIQ